MKKSEDFMEIRKNPENPKKIRKREKIKGIDAISKVLYLGFLISIQLQIFCPFLNGFLEKYLF